MEPYLIAIIIAVILILLGGSILIYLNLRKKDDGNGEPKPVTQNILCSSILKKMGDIRVVLAKIAQAKGVSMNAKQQIEPYKRFSKVQTALVNINSTITQLDGLDSFMKSELSNNDTEFKKCGGNMGKTITIVIDCDAVKENKGKLTIIEGKLKQLIGKIKSNINDIKSLPAFTPFKRQVLTYVETVYIQVAYAISVTANKTIDLNTQLSKCMV